LLMIAHRLASVQYCDKIIVLKDGCIIESGSHDQLLAHNGWYAEAWRLQQVSSTISALSS
jgi:ATP-binding cassette subfamily B multidrug efflux pump